MASLPTESIGGQAVRDGVMLRGATTWALARRTPAGTVEVRCFVLPAWSRHRVLRLPLLRGVVALAEALQVGAHAHALAGRGRTAAAAAALGLVALFVAPAIAARLAGLGLPGEALLRVVLLLGYLVALSLRSGSRRLLEYHGAEHKAVACHEAGRPLTPEHATAHPRVHARCGTSFTVLVVLVAGLVVVPLGEPAWPWLVASRLLAAPLAAGLAFELMRGRTRGLLAPLTALQRLTTREPDRAQLEVAIAALEAVLPAHGGGPQLRRLARTPPDDSSRLRSCARAPAPSLPG